MSISSANRKAGPYSCNGATVAFPFAFKVFSGDDVLVVLTDSLGVESELSLGTGYTVSINPDQDSNPGGTVTTVATYAGGNLITLTSKVQNLQSVTLTNQGGFYPQVINNALDRLTIMVQQVDEKVDRSVKVPISSSTDPDDLIAQLTSDAAAAAAAATSAAASQSAAAASESAAAGSATAAATSATSAATSATSAATSATSAATSATSAANSATSATSAANSATTATTQASNASASATNAATSATSAANSATAAASSASSAANSAATAQAAAGSATPTFRNRIINGRMDIDQRNAGALVTANDSNVYAVDRWLSTEIGNGAFSAQRVADAPNGFKNSLKVTVKTAQTGTLNALTRQPIEGLNVADLGWGAANAETVTLSFWVKSSLTGTFGGAVKNASNNRAYPFAYTINAANTWEQKTVTIPGDTTGTWATDNTTGIDLWFSHGTALLAAAGAWAAGDYRGVTGQVNLIQTLNATWQITGVQFEKGSSATPFENRLYGAELALCQRYYCKTYPQTTVPGTASVSGTPIRAVCTGNAYSTIGSWCFPVTMRATPTVTGYSPISGAAGSFSADGTDFTQLAIQAASESGVAFNVNNTVISTNSFLVVHATASAEL